METISLGRREDTGNFVRKEVGPRKFRLDGGGIQNIS